MTGKRVLFPLAFCRECGQEYYLAELVREHGEARGWCRARRCSMRLMTMPGGRACFSRSNKMASGPEDEDLPDNWHEPRSGNIKERYRPHRPRQLFVLANGSLSGKGAVERDRGLVAAAAVDALPALPGVLRPARDQRLPQARDPQPDRALDRDHDRRPRRRSSACAPTPATDRSAEAPELHG